MDENPTHTSCISDTPTQQMNDNEHDPNILTEIKQKCMTWLDEHILRGELTKTKAGSITCLLYGAKPSEQAINIKIGRLGEYLAKELIRQNPDFVLLTCGVQKINDKKKDVDLIFKSTTTNTIVYRELKGNIELDTEKLPATIQKCNEIKQSLAITYPDHNIDMGVLNWSVYDRKILTAGLSNIKSFENAGVKIDHFGDFLNILGVEWPESDFYAFWRSIGTKVHTLFI
jgi:hypothetical protein